MDQINMLVPIIGLAIMFGVTVDASSVTSYVSSTAPAPTRHIGVSEVRKMIQYVVDLFFELIEHTLHIKPWVFYTLLSFVSPYPGRLIATCAAYWEDSTNKALRQQNSNLQRQIDALIHPDVVNTQVRSYEDKIAELTATCVSVQDELLNTKEELQAATTIISVHEERLSSIESKNGYYSYSSVKNREKEHNEKIRSCLDDYNAVQTKNSELEAKLKDVRQWYADELETSEERSQIGRNLQVELDGTRQKIHQQDVEIRNLKNVVSYNEATDRPQVLLLDAVKAMVLQMADSGHVAKQFSATVFVECLQQSGIDPIKLDIDPLQFKTYATWAKDLIDRGASFLSPSSGFRPKNIGLPQSVFQTPRGPLFDSIEPSSSRPSLLDCMTRDDTDISQSPFAHLMASTPTPKPRFTYPCESVKPPQGYTLFPSVTANPHGMLTANPQATASPSPFAHLAASTSAQQALSSPCPRADVNIYEPSAIDMKKPATPMDTSEGISSPSPSPFAYLDDSTDAQQATSSLLFANLSTYQPSTSVGVQRPSADTATKSSNNKDSYFAAPRLNVDPLPSTNSMFRPAQTHVSGNADAYFTPPRLNLVTPSSTNPLSRSAPTETSSKTDSSTKSALDYFR